MLCSLITTLIAPRTCAEHMLTATATATAPNIVPRGMSAEVMRLDYVHACRLGPASSLLGQGDAPIPPAWLFLESKGRPHTSMSCLRRHGAPRYCH